MSRTIRNSYPAPKRRNWLAVHAHFRKAGTMGDARKEKSRRVCRESVKFGMYNKDGTADTDDRWEAYEEEEE